MSWNDILRLAAIVGAVGSLITLLIKLVRLMDRGTSFLKKMDESLTVAGASSELLAKKLDLMFDSVSRFLKKFQTPRSKK